MTPGQVFFVLAGQAGTAGQVPDFKIEQISFHTIFHGSFSFVVHRSPYTRDGGWWSIQGWYFALSDIRTHDKEKTKTPIFVNPNGRWIICG
jgi:hypothetical protein